MAFWTYEERKIGYTQTSLKPQFQVALYAVGTVAFMGVGHLLFGGEPTSTSLDADIVQPKGDSPAP